MLPIEDSYSGTSSVIDGLVLEFSISKRENAKTEKITTKIIAKEIISKKGPEIVIDLDSPENYKEGLKGVFINSSTISVGRDI